MILDSGDRTSFPSGAVRDLKEGKGRCDLMPVAIVGRLLGDSVLLSIGKFIETLNPYYLKESLMGYIESSGNDVYTSFLEVSIHYEEGALKYGEHNWEQGILLHSYIDSAVRHYLKFRRGDKDESHDRAFIWNILGALWTLENKKDCIDIIPIGKET